VAEHIKQEPLVLSFLLKHERKMTVLHGKVQKNPFYQGENKVESNQMVMVSVGFKRLLIEPIYSRCINGTEKTKFTQSIGEDYESHFFCSFYHHNYFPTSPFLVFRVNPLNVNQIEAAPILRGELVKCDPMHVILKRIILTGYPYKINRRRATVRYMFFNPGDVKYFKPVEIRTKLGLRVYLYECRAK
jgi:pre-rRNA-processing protein TSR1